MCINSIFELLQCKAIICEWLVCLKVLFVNGFNVNLLFVNGWFCEYTLCEFLGFLKALFVNGFNVKLLFVIG